MFVFTCEIASIILPETCHLEWMEALLETPYHPAGIQHTAACYWSLILSSGMLPSQMLCTAITPNSLQYENVKCACHIIVMQYWMLTFLSGSNSMSYWQPVSCSQCEAPSWTPNEMTTTLIECASRDLWKVMSYMDDDKHGTTLKS